MLAVTPPNVYRVDHFQHDFISVICIISFCPPGSARVLLPHLTVQTEHALKVTDLLSGRASTVTEAFAQVRSVGGSGPHGSNMIAFDTHPGACLQSRSPTVPEH